MALAFKNTSTGQLSHRRPMGHDTLLIQILNIILILLKHLFNSLLRSRPYLLLLLLISVLATIVPPILLSHLPLFTHVQRNLVPPPGNGSPNLRLYLVMYLRWQIAIIVGPLALGERLGGV